MQQGRHVYEFQLVDREVLEFTAPVAPFAEGISLGLEGAVG